MADTLTLEERSLNMSRIRNKDTEPEIYLRKLLFSLGFRYFKNSKKYPGHPDLFFKKYNTAIFVNGCFWHRHEGCKLAYTPKSRQDYWEKKFKSNVDRDLRVKDEMYDRNIRCLIVWECTIRKMKKSPIIKDIMIHQIIDFFNSKEMYLEI